MCKSHLPCRLHRGKPDEKCSICKLQIDKPGLFNPIKHIRVVELLAAETVKQATFTQLVVKLLPPSAELEGCPIFMPDTAFIEDGKPNFIVKTDKDGKLSSTNNPAKMTYESIRTTFQKVVNERQKYCGRSLHIIAQQNI